MVITTCYLIPEKPTEGKTENKWGGNMKVLGKKKNTDYITEVYKQVLMFKFV